MTSRERQVLDRLCEGQSVKRIARELHLSVHTVRGYVASIRAQRGAESTTHLVVLELRSRCACAGGAA